MEDPGSSVTLIFYRINEKWWTEPALNVISAAAQMSSLTHCEIAIGEEAGQNGTMRHVARIFNDKEGVELVERTGRNPQNIYLQLGCSKHAEQKMLHYVRTQCIGKPFSNLAMFRSLLWPRQTDEIPTSFFCAELVAAILRQGGLMDSASNPGAATPEMLHRIYAPRAAVAGNPCVLRDVQKSSMHFHNTVGSPHYALSDRAAEHERLLHQRAVATHATTTTPTSVAPVPAMMRAPQHQQMSGRGRSSSPHRAHFRDVSRNQYASSCVARAPASQTGIQLTLNSLDFSKSRR